MKTGKSLQELAIELERQNEVKRDYIADTREIMMRIPEYHGNEQTPDPVLSLPKIPDFTINGVAHDQIATKTGIPINYYNKMLEKKPQLLADNVNTWFQKNPDKRMIRTLDGTARAFLSDRYRRIDNHEIATAVLPIIQSFGEGARVDSCELTDKRMYIKVVNERITTEVSKGDVVQSGILISNSETGLGSVTVMPLVYRVVCSNGMIANTAGQRSRHVGRTNEGEENFEIYSNETIIQDDKTFVMKLQDIVRSTANIVQFERVVAAMKISKEAKITSDNVPGVVQLAAKNFGLYEKESQSVLDHLIRGGELSLYGLANAVTRHAHDVDSYDRSTELEITGWKMLNMTRPEWTKLNAA
jgi:hypothetical protein